MRKLLWPTMDCDWFAMLSTGRNCAKRFYRFLHPVGSSVEKTRAKLQDMKLWAGRYGELMGMAAWRAMELSNHPAKLSECTVACHSMNSPYLHAK